MKRRISNTGIGMLSVFLVCYILYQGGSMLSHGFVEELFLPGLSYVTRQGTEKSWTTSYMTWISPLYAYMNDHTLRPADVEDKLTYEMILAQQAKDEERMSEDLQEIKGDSVETVGQTVAGKDALLSKLQDYNYLLSQFYTVDSTTTVAQGQLNVNDFMSRDMHIDRSKKGPKVLIFHTHSQEDFVDSTAGDTNTTIVGIGRYLAEQLNAKGIETLHHDGVYDLIDGQLDRSKAYEMAEKGVKKILNQNPSIEVVIDLHRDGVPETTHLVTTVDGKQTAKFMFFNGLSRTKTNGDIAYLKNPYIQDNLAFSFQMQLETESMYPGLARRIYLKGYRYSLHMMPKSLLIEAGAQTNSVGEMKNSMELLANILVEVLL